MKILIAGAAGQVGQALQHNALASQLDLISFDRKALDILDADAVAAAISAARPDVVINSAAYTAVDRAQTESDMAFAINESGPRNLAVACAASGAALIHLSTDYVFDGSAPGSRLESDTVSPLGVYGESKAAGETAVRDALEQHVILRLSWVFGEHGGNFVRTMVRLARERDELKVVDDQHGCPSYTGHIADAILGIAIRLKDAPVWGTFHYRDSPPTTWHGFATRIIEQARTRFDLRVAQVLAVPSTEFPTPAARPQNSVLDCEKIAISYGIRPQLWVDGLEKVIAALPAD